MNYKNMIWKKVISIVDQGEELYCPLQSSDITYEYDRVLTANLN